MNSSTCGNCTHFRQHYVKINGGYHKITYGHCVFPRRKKRESNASACKHYKDGEK